MAKATEDGRTCIEAYKTVDGREAEWIDPVIGIRFNDDSFTIFNGHEYEYPFEEFGLWAFRKITT